MLSKLFRDSDVEGKNAPAAHNSSSSTAAALPNLLRGGGVFECVSEKPFAVQLGRHKDGRLQLIKVFNLAADCILPINVSIVRNQCYTVV
jgi:hypothetical protein